MFERRKTPGRHDLIYYLRQWEYKVLPEPRGSEGEAGEKKVSNGGLLIEDIGTQARIWEHKYMQPRKVTPEPSAGSSDINC